jgi:hypothetical protein
VSAQKGRCPDCRELKAECMCLDEEVAPAAVPPRCLYCLDDGMVCEDHPGMPWEGIWGTVEGHAEHGGIGMPCPACCSPIPEDGTHSIAEAFAPDWKRAARPPASDKTGDR